MIPTKLEILKDEEANEFLFGTGEGDGTLGNPIKFIGLTKELADEITFRYNAFDDLLAACNNAFTCLCGTYIPENIIVGDKIKIDSRIAYAMKKLEAAISAAEAKK